MVRSGLQQDVINLYRECIKAAMSKPPNLRPAFLLHMRYNFRNPQLRQRDYVAIEHQLRKMSKTLEMLSDPSVQRISVSDEMESWWQEEISKSKSRTITESQIEKDEIKKTDAEGRDRDQMAGKLPGHGGT